MNKMIMTITTQQQQQQKKTENKNNNNNESKDRIQPRKCLLSIIFISSYICSNNEKFPRFLDQIFV